MTDKKRGLGELDWLTDRSEAEASMYRESQPATGDPAAEQTQETPEDQAKQDTRKAASKSASESAIRKGGQRKVTATALDEAPPPPGRQREARVQFNHRVLMDRHEVLESYKTEHGATWQAIVDQMVDEYLARRGLLPESDSTE